MNIEILKGFGIMCIMFFSSIFLLLYAIFYSDGKYKDEYLWHDDTWFKK